MLPNLTRSMHAGWLGSAAGSGRGLSSPGTPLECYPMSRGIPAMPDAAIHGN